MLRGLSVSSVVFLLLLMWLIASGKPVRAEPIPWSNSSGVGAFFDWSSGGSDSDRFGDPVLANGNTFVFSPSSFEATSLDGDPALTGDRLEVRLQAHQGHAFTRIEIHETGEYEFDGTGETMVTAAVFGINLDPYQLTKDEWSFQAEGTEASPDPLSSEGEGTREWNGMYFIDFPGTTPSWQYIQIVLDDNLMATSDSSSKSSIKKKSVTIIVTPEPDAMLLLLFGSLAGSRRRRP